MRERERLAARILQASKARERIIEAVLKRYTVPAD